MQRQFMLATVFVAPFVGGSLDAADVSVDQKMLIGLRAVSVVVDSNSEEIGLTKERLRTITELQLRRGGLRVDSGDSAKAVYVDVQVISAGRCGTAFSIAVDLLERIEVPAPRGVVTGKVWSSGSLGIAPRSISSARIEAAVIKHLDVFENDLRAANPDR